jgi:hypothetical protein
MALDDCDWVGCCSVFVQEMHNSAIMGNAKKSFFIVVLFLIVGIVNCISPSPAQ